MAYFSHGSTKHKFMLLYFLKELNYEITRDEMFRVFAEQRWMDYFDFQSAFVELEEDGYIAAVPCAFGQGYRVSTSGDETIAMFDQELPYSLRESIRNYVADNRVILRNRSQIAAFKTHMPGGGYSVVLNMMDKSAHILDITIRLPDAHFSQMAVDRWPELAGEVYGYLLNRLCAEEKADQ